MATISTRLAGNDVLTGAPMVPWISTSRAISTAPLVVGNHHKLASIGLTGAGGPL
jgi:hypothetical protein